MNYKIEISRGAKKEIADQVLYYETQMTGLGKRFSEELLQHLRHIGRYPFARTRYAKIKCVPLLKFPFMIHYSVSEADNTVLIHALTHTSRNPNQHWNKGDWKVSEELSAYGLHVYDMEYFYAA